MILELMKILLVIKVKVFEKTNDGKQILRKALSQYLPELITNAEKDFPLQMLLGSKIKV